MSVKDKALLIKKYSHVVLTRVRLCEPAPRQAGQPVPWADAGIEQYFEDCASGTVVPFLMMSAMLLYPGMNYAHGCHLSTLRTSVGWLNEGIEQWRKGASISEAEIEALPPRGAVGIDVRTLVPREQAAKIVSGVTLYANDAKVATAAQAIAATNPAMVVQLGLALKDLWAKASPASAQAMYAPPS